MEDVGKIKNFYLLFRASKHGWNAEDFHRKCDDQGATLVIVKSSNGSIFGGFASLSWNSSDYYESDPKAFIYSLYTNKKFKPNNSINNLTMKGSIGPTFG